MIFFNSKWRTTHVMNALKDDFGALKNVDHTLINQTKDTIDKQEDHSNTINFHRNIENMVQLFYVIITL